MSGPAMTKGTTIMNGQPAGGGNWLKVVGIVYLIRAIRRRRQRRQDRASLPPDSARDR
jgi:hypothetical protein